MDVAAVLILIQKGIQVASALIEAGRSAAPAIAALTSLVSGARKGNVTDTDLDKTEAVLDSLIADFNIELPDA